jgi:tRNA threonylcarbamoyladenosine biosynthesis protein TsaB
LGEIANIRYRVQNSSLPVQWHFSCPGFTNERSSGFVDPCAVQILALDTSTEYCSAAFWRDGHVFDRVEHAGQRHSELLIPMIRAVLAEGGASMHELDAIAATVGPGTFTGVRIATAVAQGLAFGARVPVVAVGTLEAMAAACNAQRVVVASDARMGEVYCAAYRRNTDHLETLFGPMLAKPDSVPTLTERGFVGAGNGFERYRDALMQCWAESIESVADVSYPHARDVAALAATRVAIGLVAPAEALTPVYVRDKVALTVSER